VKAHSHLLAFASPQLALHHARRNMAKGPKGPRAACSSSLLITFSFIFFILGAAILGTSIAAIAMPLIAAITPTSVAGVGIGVGALLLIGSIAGCKGACDPRKVCSLGFFLGFATVIFIISLVLTVLAFTATGALDASVEQNFVDLSGAEERVGAVVKDMAQKMWTACYGEVDPIAGSNNTLYSLSCTDADYQFVADAANTGCIGPSRPVTDSASLEACYSDESWWAPPSDWLDVETNINTDKGLFCECGSEIVDYVSGTLDVVRWVGLGVTALFGMVVLATCYLCCCAKKKPKQDAGAGFHTVRPCGPPGPPPPPRPPTKQGGHSEGIAAIHGYGWRRRGAPPSRAPTMTEL